MSNTFPLLIYIVHMQLDILPAGAAVVNIPPEKGRKKTAFRRSFLIYLYALAYSFPGNWGMVAKPRCRSSSVGTVSLMMPSLYLP